MLPRAPPPVLARPLITSPGDWKHETHQLFFRPSSSPRARLLHLSTCALIFLSTACFVLQTLASVAPWAGWGIVDGLIAIIFTVEYVLRLYVAPFGPGDESSEHETPPSSDREARIRFALQPLALVDLFAVLPFWLELAWIILPDFLRWPVAIIRAVRLVRVLRLLRLAQSSRELSVLVRCAQSLSSALRLLLFFLALTTTIVGGLVFHAEARFLEDGVWWTEKAQRSEFQSIPEAAWWCLVTVTAVGYGDKVPRTALGMLIGSGAILLGVAGVAVFVALVAAEIHKLRQEDSTMADCGADAQNRFHQNRTHASGLQPLCAQSGIAPPARSARGDAASPPVEAAEKPRGAGDGGAVNMQLDMLDWRVRSLEAKVQAVLEQNEKILELLTSRAADSMG